MKTKMLTRARQLFNSELVPREVNRANQRKWVRAVRSLGRQWVYWESPRLERSKR